MATTFYPFVENSGCSDDANIAQPSTSARIAVYDDMSMPPRVVLVEPSDITSYLSNITQTVYELVSQKCDEWPFMVIRELVENYIHALFIEPSISILDKGRTIVFSDQGPGIANKEASRGVGFSSATPAMKKYIRGVGSGFPIVESHLKSHGGTIRIEDNLGHGTIVTVSLSGAETQEAVQAPAPTMSSAPAMPAAAGHQPMPMGMPMGGYPQDPAGRYPQNPAGEVQGYGQGTYGYQQAGYGYMQQMPQAGGMPYYGYPQAQGGAYPGYPQPYGNANPWPAQQAHMGGYGAAPQYAQPTMPQQPYGAPQAAQQPYGMPYGGAQGAPAGYEPAQAVYAAPQGQAWEQPGVAPRAVEAASGMNAHVPLTAEERDILKIFAQVEKVGPTELNRRLGIAAATGSRKLGDLSRAGYITKNGQKYILTGEGERVLSYLVKGEA